MLALTVLLFAGMLFGVAAVSVGHGNALSEPSIDRREPVLPTDAITAGTVESLRFTMALRGYRMDEVDAVLDRLSAELSVRDAEIGRLRAGAGGVAPVPLSTLDDPSHGPQQPHEQSEQSGQDGAFQAAEVPPPAFAPPGGQGPPPHGAAYDAPAYEPPAPYDARPQAGGPEAEQS